MSHEGKKEEYSCGYTRRDPSQVHPVISSVLVLFERGIFGKKGAARFHLI
jgi:hypothetical protein